MLLSVNPRAIETLRTTAAAKAANVVAQKLSATSVRKVQQLLQMGNFAGGLLGLNDITNEPQPLLGGLTLNEARDMYASLADAQLSRKNLFFIRVIDHNPPPIAYAEGSYFTSMFNLFALDVSYPGVTLQGEKVPLGSAALDKLMGREAQEISITTMDDSRGTLKRWFKAKSEQAARTDGTFGLPSSYWLDLECYHATPQANEDAFKNHIRMRCQSMTSDLSRRDQAMEEVQMTFTQVDTFLTP